MASWACSRNAECRPASSGFGGTTLVNDLPGMSSLRRRHSRVIRAKSNKGPPQIEVCRSSSGRTWERRGKPSLARTSLSLLGKAPAEEGLTIGDRSPIRLSVDIASEREVHREAEPGTTGTKVLHALQKAGGTCQRVTGAIT